MKKIFFILLVLCGTHLAAQNGSYEDRYAQLYKSYFKDTNNVAAMVALSDYYIEENNPFRNIPLAQKYISRAEVLYVEILSDEDKSSEARKLLRKKLTLQMVRDRKNEIILFAYDYLTSDEEISRAELNDYKIAFAESKPIVRCVERRLTRMDLEEAYAENTIEGYMNFVESHQGLGEADEANVAMNKLALEMFAQAKDEYEVRRLMEQYENNDVVKRAAEKRLAHLSYERACEINTLQAYQSYLAQYPSGDDYLEALNRIESLLDQNYDQLDTPQEYADFILHHSDNRLAEDAMEKLRKLIVEDHSVEAARIYIQNFPLDEKYLDIYKLYYSWHTQEGNKNPIERFAAENPQYPFRVLVDKDLEMAQEADRIYLLEKFNNANIDVYASYIRRLTGKGLSFVALQRTLQDFISAHNWKEASKRMGDYMLSFDENAYQKPFEELRALLTAPAKKNSQAYAEYCPAYDIRNAVLHPNGKSLYYTREVGKMRSIWVAGKASSKKSKWNSGSEVRFTNDPNSDLTIFGFYEGGEKMLVGRGGDILSASYEDGVWTINDIFGPAINTAYRESDAAMLPDGSGMLFVSDRPGGYNLQASGSYFHGDTAMASDIYFVPKTDDGWGKAVNIGMDVNTPYCERSPLMSSDMKTLYFVSDGRGGLGYGDVYVTVRQNQESWTSWSVPENLGKEVNSAYWDDYVTFGNDERQLLISSNSNGRYGCYMANAQHTGAKAYQKVTINYESLKGVGSQLVVLNNTSRSIIHTIQMNETGRAELKLSADYEYAICVPDAKVLIPSVVFKPKTGCEVNIDVEAFGRAIYQSQEMKFELLSFEKNKATFKSLCEYDLNQILQFLTANPGYQAEVIVNAPEEDPETAFNLSIERGKRIKDFLVERGVKSSRVVVSAFGNVNYKSNPGCGEVSVRFSGN